MLCTHSILSRAGRVGTRRLIQSQLVRCCKVERVAPEVLCGRRYDHVGCSLHVKKCGIELHARPWHWGWRPVLGDHFLGK